MWSFAKLTLGLSESEFWDLSLAQWQALLERHEDKEREKDYRHGVLITLVRQGLGEKRANISDYFPRIEKAKRKRSGDFQTLKANLQAHNNAKTAKKKDE